MLVWIATADVFHTYVLWISGENNLTFSLFLSFKLPKSPEILSHKNSVDTLYSSNDLFSNELSIFLFTAPFFI